MTDLRVAEIFDEPWALVHVITKLELGGAQLATLKEVTRSQLPWKKRYLVYGGGGILDAEAEALPDVQCLEVSNLIRDLSPRKDIAALTELVRIFRDIGKDGKFLVHTHSSKAGILGRVAARLAGADRVIHSIHGFGHSHHPNAIVRKDLWGAEKVASYCTDGFTGDSSANLVQGKEQCLIGKTPHGVVYCGVDTEEFRFVDPDDGHLQTLREDLSIARESHIILNISCLKPQKDPLTYVEVAERVLKEHPNTVFLLAGDGELRGELEATIEKLGIESSVRLLGWRRDIPSLLALSDIMVLTSLWEGLPQSFGQAMATGTPIVATRVDGAPEAIVEGVNGLLYDTKDVDGLSSGISRLLGDEKTRREMGERARESAPRFSEETMLDTLDSFYTSIL